MAEAEIGFYRLTRRFVDAKKAQGRSENLIYYTQAIGHHIGVLDCLEPVLKIEESEYKRLLAGMPEGKARRKLEGVLKWGEIEITKEHVANLLQAFGGKPDDPPRREGELPEQLTTLLRLLDREPLIYLVVRRTENDSCSRWGTN